MAAAPAFVRASGGIEATRVFTRIWLALFGAWSWDDLPEHAAGDDASAALVPAQRLRLGLLGAPDRRPADRRRQPAPGAPAAVRHRRAAHRRCARRRRDRRVDAGRASSSGSTGCCTATPAARSRPLRRGALRRAAEWILARQEADGSWGGIQPPWVYSLIALHLLGYPLDHPVMRRRPRRARRLHRPRADPGRAGPPARGVPVAGVGHRAGADRAARRRRARPTDPAVRRAADWLLARGDPGAGRLVGAPARRSRRAGGRSSSPTTATRTPTTPPRSCWRCAAPPRTSRSGGRRAADRPRGRAGRPACSRATAAGARSTPTTPGGSPRSCRSATSARSSTRRRADVTAHVVEMLAAEGLGRLRRRPPGRRLAAAPARSRRLVVRPLGRQPRLRHRRGRAGARRRRACAPDDAAIRAGGRLAGGAPERRRRLGRGPALLPRPGLGRARRRRPPSQTAWALLALLAAGERGHHSL